MKFNTKIAVVVYALLTMTSCSQQGREVPFADTDYLSLDDFEHRKELTGTSVQFDDEVMMPFSVQVHDSVLFSLEYGREDFIHLYNLNSHKKIGSRIHMGEGPGEMSMPMFVNNDGKTIQLVDMASAKLYTYNLKEFLETPDVKPLSAVQMSCNSDAEMHTFKDGFLGFQFGKNPQLNLFNSAGEVTAEWAEYPVCTAKSYSPEESMDAFTMGVVSNGSDRFALCYYLTPLIEIYDGEGKRVKSLYGPDNVLPGKGEETAQNTDTYFCPRKAGDSFMVLYNGGKVSDENHSSSCTRIYSFSWNGKPEICYELDQPIFTYCIDSSKRMVYGVCDTPEPHIVEYKY